MGCHSEQSQPLASVSVVLYPSEGAEHNVDDGYVLGKITSRGGLPLPRVEVRTSVDERME